MSSVWKSLNTGSSAKNGAKHFCHLCPCTDGEIGSFLVDDNRFDNCFIKLTYCIHCIQLYLHFPPIIIFLGAKAASNLVENVATIGWLAREFCRTFSAGIVP